MHVLVATLVFLLPAEEPGPAPGEDEAPVVGDASEPAPPGGSLQRYVAFLLNPMDGVASEGQAPGGPAADPDPPGFGEPRGNVGSCAASACLAPCLVLGSLALSEAGYQAQEWTPLPLRQAFVARAGQALGLLGAGVGALTAWVGTGAALVWLLVLAGSGGLDTNQGGAAAGASLLFVGAGSMVLVLGLGGLAALMLAASAVMVIAAGVDHVRNGT